MPSLTMPLAAIADNDPYIEVLRHTLPFTAQRALRARHRRLVAESEDLSPALAEAVTGESP